METFPVLPQFLSNRKEPPSRSIRCIGISSVKQNDPDAFLTPHQVIQELNSAGVDIGSSTSFSGGSEPLPPPDTAALWKRQNQSAKDHLQLMEEMTFKTVGKNESKRLQLHGDSSSQETD